MISSSRKSKETFSHGSSNFNRSVECEKWRKKTIWRKQSTITANETKASVKCIHTHRNQRVPKNVSAQWNYCKYFAPKTEPQHQQQLYDFSKFNVASMFCFTVFALYHKRLALILHSPLPLSEYLALTVLLPSAGALLFVSERFFCYLNSCTFTMELQRKRKRFHAQFTLHMHFYDTVFFLHRFSSFVYRFWHFRNLIVRFELREKCAEREEKNVLNKMHRVHCTKGKRDRADYVCSQFITIIVKMPRARVVNESAHLHESPIYRHNVIYIRES